MNKFLVKTWIQFEHVKFEDSIIHSNIKEEAEFEVWDLEETLGMEV